jgi:phosphoglycolate phosphatase-like HAD superfamily hydrolase
VFTSALHALHVPPQEAIVIGDTPYDVEAAKKIELPTIALLCGGFGEDELRASGAVVIDRDPADLLESYLRSPLCG